MTTPILPPQGSGSLGGDWLEEVVELPDGRECTRLNLMGEMFGENVVSSGTPGARIDPLSCDNDTPPIEVKVKFVE